MIVSIFTGLFTEGIKKLLDEMTVKYHSNFLAGGVAVVLSTLVGAGYLILTETQINDKMAVYLIALVLLSWLASMVGYDKVIQAIAQLKRTDNNTQGGRKVAFSYGRDVHDRAGIYQLYGATGAGRHGEKRRTGFSNNGAGNPGIRLR